MDRTRRSELLALADRESLIMLGERCLEATDADTARESTAVGRVALDVLDPTKNTRFHLADVVVAEATVVLGEVAGWSMRLGDDALAAVAGAVCDAHVETGGPLAADVIQLCEETAADQRRRHASQSRQLRTTEVVFE